jgi:cell division transport system permease protein
MNAWLAQHIAALRLALRRLSGAPVNTLLSSLAIGVALALPAGGQMLLGNAVQLALNSAPQPQLSIFMDVSADAKTVAALGERLKQHRQIAKVEFLPKDDTLNRMKTSASFKDVIEVLGRNPFPDAFVLTPRDDSPQAMEALAAEMRKQPKVEHVQLDSAWVQRMDALLRLGRTSLVLLTTLLGAGLIAITFNIIRLQVLTMKAEIEVSRLLGATDGYIRRPFVYFGTLLGLLGGMVAWLLVAATAQGLQVPLTELAHLYGLSLQFSGLSAQNSILLLALAAALGWIGATLSLFQHLRGNR